MALIQLGGGVTDARGSVGGTVFSRNQGGNYTRRRVAPVNPRTPAQTLVRSNFGGNSRTWSGAFTDSQRSAWGFFAQANPTVNRLGASIILTGMAMSQRLNQVLSQIGAPTITDPPADLSVPALAAVTSVVVTGSLNIVNLVTDAQSVVANAKYYVMATGNLAPGKKPPKNAYRFIGAFDATAAATTVQMDTEWEAVFGAPLAGSTVGFSVRTVNTDSGALTPEVIFYSTVL